MTILDADDVANQINTWYSRIDVQFEMCKFLKNREFALLSPKAFPKDRGYNVRNLRCHSPQHYQFYQKKLHLRDKKYIMNHYYSIARYLTGVPLVDAEEIYSGKKNTWWLDNHHKEMMSYDLFVDIDAGDDTEILPAVETVLNIKNYFDKLSVPHEIRFSGRGFHMIVPFESFMFNISRSLFDPMNLVNSVYVIYQDILDGLNRDFSEMVDTKINDSRRLCKIPYSCAVYEDVIRVCLPVNNIDSIRNFDLNSYELSNIDKRIRGRSSVIYNVHGDSVKLMEAFTDGVEDEA